jgi:hypothetical protein
MRDAVRRNGTAAMPAAPAPSGSEHRVSARIALLMRAAKLVCPTGEFLCVVRDASDSGASIKLFHALPQTDTLVLEFSNGDRHPLDLVWQEGDRAGLRFARTADIARLLDGPSRFGKRPIRVNLDLPGKLLAGISASPVQLRDLSQQGAKVECDMRLAIDQRVRLAAKGLPEVNAKVRWRRDTAYGLVFEDIFQFADLALILAALQADAAMPKGGTPAPRR